MSIWIRGGALLKGFVLGRFTRAKIFTLTSAKDFTSGAALPAAAARVSTLYGGVVLIGWRVSRALSGVGVARSRVEKPRSHQTPFGQPGRGRRMHCRLLVRVDDVNLSVTVLLVGLCGSV